MLKVVQRLEYYQVLLVAPKWEAQSWTRTSQLVPQSPPPGRSSSDDRSGLGVHEIAVFTYGTFHFSNTAQSTSLPDIEHLLLANMSSLGRSNHVLDGQ